MKKHFAFLLIFFLLFSCSSENDPGKIYVLESMQKSAFDAYGRGEMYLLDLEAMAQDKSEPQEFLKRIKQIHRHALHIDSLFGVAVYHIEQLKWQLFEDIGVSVNKRKLSYLSINELSAKNSTCPNSYYWDRIRHSGSSDLFDDGTIQELKSTLRRVRKGTCEYLAFSVNREDTRNKFSFVDPQINDYKDADDFTRLYTSKTQKQHIPPDDAEIIKRMYFALTKNEEFWQNALTPKNDWTEVMQLLLALETDILDARANAITSIRFRIGCGADFGFTHILPVIDAPTAAQAGDTIEYTVFMGAYDADRKPSFTTSQETTLLYVKDGIGYFQTVVPRSGKVDLKGTITIFNKSGIPKTSIWKRSVQVVSP